jgi:hypothetical protein
MAVVETKVKASTAAAAVSGLALWALGRYVFKGTVPDVVASWVYVLVPGLLAWGAGYLAPHTPRGGTYLPITPLPQPTAATLEEKTLQPPPGAGM